MQIAEDCIYDAFLFFFLPGRSYWQSRYEKSYTSLADNSGKFSQLFQFTESNAQS